MLEGLGHLQPPVEEYAELSRKGGGQVEIVMLAMFSQRGNKPDGIWSRGQKSRCPINSHCHRL